MKELRELLEYLEAGSYPDSIYIESLTLVRRADDILDALRKERALASHVHVVWMNATLRGEPIDWDELVAVTAKAASVDVGGAATRFVEKARKLLIRRAIDLMLDSPVEQAVTDAVIDGRVSEPGGEDIRGAFRDFRAAARRAMVGSS